MSKQLIIPPVLLIKTMTLLGWVKEDAEVDESTVLRYKDNFNVKVYIPKSVDKIDYSFHQNRTLSYLLRTLKIEETEETLSEIQQQILFPNYKLINRIVIEDRHNSETVPFEYADRVIKYNISSFKTEYVLTAAKQIPLENFQMNHTRKGSFVIPISIPAEYDENTLLPIPSLTNTVLKNYLDKINNLADLDITNEKKFAEQAIERNIDSKLVKDFMSQDGLAKYNKQYEKIVERVEISGESSPIIDFNLADSEKHFSKAYLEKLQVVPDVFIETLKSLEIKTDQGHINEEDVSIEAIVDSLSYSDKNRTEGTMKFTIYKVGNEAVKKPFKAVASGLTKKRLKKFGEIFYTAEIVKLRGDVFKSKGKIGDLRIEEILEADKQPDLFKEIVK